MSAASAVFKGLNPAEIQAELARRGANVAVSSPADREFQKKELDRCISDVVYWIRTYCVTHDPRLQDRFILFDPFPHQIDLLAWLAERLDTQTNGCIEKSKDVGATHVCVYFMLHQWLWSEGFAGGLGSRDLQSVDSIGDPSSLFEKFRMTLRRLPAWQLPRGFDWKKHSMEARLINPVMNSTLMGDGGKHIGRGGRSSMYLVDEYNVLEHPDLADAALRDNSNVIIYLGTPNGLVGIAEKKTFLPTFRMHWINDPRKNAWESKAGAVIKRGVGPHPSAPIPTYKKHPTKTQGRSRVEGGIVVTYPWYEAQCEKHRDNPWIVAQEIDIDYLGSGSPRFDREYLNSLLDPKKLGPLPSPLFHETPGDSGWSAEVKTWKDAKRGHRYLFVSDVAEGESNDKGDPDFSVTHVYDADEWEQVCHYRGRPDTHAYAVDLAALGEMYNWADIAVERTGPGLAVVKALTEEIGYPCVWRQQMGENHSKAGITASATFKKTSEDELAGYIGDMKEGFPGFKWNEENTIKELIHFVRKPSGRAEAESGYHDDECTCCKIAAVLLPMVSDRRRNVPEKPPDPKVYYGRGRR